ncbi:MAG: hypothetical protein MK066_09840 [Crocinitomicaceae bacterium]|nr:hypothetical protein [Crocinitomicaceae bacterium]
MVNLNCFGQVKGSIIDERDSTLYGTVTIDSLIWMTDNLNFDTLGAVQYPDSCEACGLLYSYSSAKNACPTGFRLPLISEWNDLFTSLGGELEIEDFGLYYHGIKDTLQSSELLELRYCGLHNFEMNTFNYCGTYSAYWHLNNNEFKAIHFEKSQYSDWVGTANGDQYTGFSVRCVKDM